MAISSVAGRDQGLIDRAVAALEDERLTTLVFDMTAIRSATGEERELADYVVGHMQGAGLDAQVQPVDGGMANAIGTLRGTGDGVRLMLYAPLDTAFAGVLDEDEPWIGRELRPDFALPPRRENGKVVGLGAENPKAFGAAGIAALEALAAAGAQLRGDASIALAGGSMPVNHRPGIEDPVVGHGVGIRHLLDHGPLPDCAIVLKPGYAVAYEEVGLTWFRLTVHGTVNYTGIRHKGVYRNPILDAVRLITHLEAWFPEYVAANTSGLVAPQASINAIRAGSAEQAAFIPQSCQIDLDLRVAPDTSVDEVTRQFEAAIERIRLAEPDLQLTVERTAAMPGTRTDPSSPIIAAVIRAWEAVEGRPHSTLANTSGATDAAVIRSRGIPTARIGLPQPATPNPYPGFSMGQADIGSIKRLAEVLIHAIVEVDSLPASAFGQREGSQ